MKKYLNLFKFKGRNKLIAAEINAWKILNTIFIVKIHELKADEFDSWYKT